MAFQVQLPAPTPTTRLLGRQRMAKADIVVVEHTGGTCLRAGPITHTEGDLLHAGQVSAPMTKDAGARYVIVGHSERRRYLGETDASVHLKIQACLRNKLSPIICIGEHERNQEEEIKKQFHAALLGMKKADVRKMLLVYEPVWAISGNSGGMAASFDDTLSGLLFMRKMLVKAFDTHTARAVKILYGGSVNSENASVFVNKVGFDGVLVGSASLDKNEFVRLIKSI